MTRDEAREHVAKVAFLMLRDAGLAGTERIYRKDTGYKDAALVAAEVEALMEMLRARAGETLEGLP